MRIDLAKLGLAMMQAGINTSKQLAEISGVSVNTISRIHNGGSAKIPTVRRLAAALGTDPANIVKED